MFRQKNVIVKSKSKQKVLDERLQFRLLEELTQIQSGKETDERLVRWMEEYFQMNKKEETSFRDEREYFYQYSLPSFYRQLIKIHQNQDEYDPVVKERMTDAFDVTKNEHYKMFFTYLTETINMKPNMITYENLQLLTILLFAVQKIYDNQKRKEVELVELLDENKNSMNATEDYDTQFKKAYYLVIVTKKILEYFSYPKQFFRLKLAIGLQECKLEFTREYIEPMITAVITANQFSLEKQQHVLDCLQMWLDRCDMNNPVQKMILREVFEKLEMLIEKIDQNHPYRNLLFGVVSDKKNEAFPIRRSRPAIYAQGAGSRRK